MLNKITPRTYYLLGFFICLSLLTGAFFLQAYDALAPCPLCELQRIVFALLGIIFLIAALQNPQYWGVKIYGYLLFLVAIVGGGVALKQLWLQYSPQMPSQTCAAGVEYILKTLPLLQAFRTLLQGSGDCAKQTWEAFGLSLPAWAFIGFCFLGFLSIWQNFRVSKSYGE